MFHFETESSFIVEISILIKYEEYILGWHWMNETLLSNAGYYSEREKAKSKMVTDSAFLSKQNSLDPAMIWNLPFQKRAEEDIIKYHELKWFL